MTDYRHQTCQCVPDAVLELCPAEDAAVLLVPISCML